MSKAKTSTTKKTNTKDGHKNRGLEWEDLIIKKCDEYRQQGIAVLHKIPTEFKVLRKFNPKTKKSEIFSAFPVEATRMVDFAGVYQGKALAIETKKTDLKTRFPFANIGEHQFEFFKDWHKVGGLGYYLIWFKELNKIFLVHSLHIQEVKDTLDRESIPIEWFLGNDNVIEIGEDLDFIKYIQ